jgi:hypothetical protein
MYAHKHENHIKILKKQPLSPTNYTLKTKTKTKPYSQKSTDIKKTNGPPSHIMAPKQEQSQNYSRTQI